MDIDLITKYRITAAIFVSQKLTMKGNSARNTLSPYRHIHMYITLELVNNSEQQKINSGAF